ncbi:diguanylate cyclase [Phytohabitans flavus]|uniref:Putative 4-hydroxy-4-methyl-2-oxoglutarate aldolase n=1 Tax=Phytohabitans flavus TaxID=1076124 RepID=A0A6F8XVP4_9ACTN|nr:RraA family protein [Phytohabitans flavus]BCB77893.1 diguanylate cyclase [Phytohabitans flavus]
MNQPLDGLSTATVSDALDKLGLDGSMLGLGALTPDVRICGPAFTVRYVAAGRPAGTVGDYLDDVPPGHVVVLDNAGRLDCTVWGDILTALAHHKGVGGTVIDGVCRDTARALELGYPVVSRGRFMRTGKDRVEVSGTGVPVSAGGVQVVAGDTIVADGDGAVRVPAAEVERVAEVAHAIADAEAHILADVLGGVSLAEARARNGYHALQRRGA